MKIWFSCYMTSRLRYACRNDSIAGTLRNIQRNIFVKTNNNRNRDLIFCPIRVIDRPPIFSAQGRWYEMDNRAGELLRDRRLELGLSQEELALELGMSIHQYQRYEYGETKLANCRMQIGLRICAILELNPFEAVFGPDYNRKL